MKIEQINELKKEIKQTEKKKAELERQLNEELLPAYVGKYYKHKNYFYYLKVDEYSKEYKLLNCWSMSIDPMWNNQKLFTTEYLSFMSISSFDDMVEISKDVFDVALQEYLDAIKQSFAVRGE